MTVVGHHRATQASMQRTFSRLFLGIRLIDAHECKSPRSTAAFVNHFRLGSTWIRICLSYDDLGFALTCESGDHFFMFYFYFVGGKKAYFFSLPKKTKKKSPDRRLVSL